MDDYIFLIIAIVISIFAAIKKNKKKEIATPEKLSNAEPGHFLFDQFLGETPGEEPADEFDFPDWPSMESEKKPVARPEMVKPEVVMPEPKSWDIPRETFKSHLPERKKATMHISVKRMVEEEEYDEEEQSETTSYLEDFSLRKAVIYAEIMKPKFENNQTTLF